MIKVLGSLAVALVVGGWGAHVYVTETLASKDEVQVAGGKADYVLDRQMEATIKQIAYLERKGSLTPSEQAQLDYLRRQLQGMREVRAGKK